MRVSFWLALALVCLSPAFTAPARAQTWDTATGAGGIKVARVAMTGGASGFGLACEGALPVLAINLRQPPRRNPALLTLRIGAASGAIVIARNGATNVWAAVVRDARVLNALASGQSVAMAVDGVAYGSVPLAGAGEAMRSALAGCWAGATQTPVQVSPPTEARPATPALPVAALAAWENYARTQCRLTKEGFVARQFRPYIKFADPYEDRRLDMFITADFNGDRLSDFAVVTAQICSGIPVEGDHTITVNFVVSSGSGYQAFDGFGDRGRVEGIRQCGDRDVLALDGGPVWGWKANTVTLLGRADIGTWNWSRCPPSSRPALAATHAGGSGQPATGEPTAGPSSSNVGRGAPGRSPSSGAPNLADLGQVMAVSDTSSPVSAQTSFPTRDPQTGKPRLPVKLGAWIPAGATCARPGENLIFIDSGEGAHYDSVPNTYSEIKTIRVVKPGSYVTEEYYSAGGDAESNSTYNISDPEHFTVTHNDGYSKQTSRYSYCAQAALPIARRHFLGSEFRRVAALPVKAGYYAMGQMGEGGGSRRCYDFCGFALVTPSGIASAFTSADKPKTVTRVSRRFASVTQEGPLDYRSDETGEQGGGGLFTIESTELFSEYEYSGDITYRFVDPKAVPAALTPRF